MERTIFCDFYSPQSCNDGTLTFTPSGWQWVSSVTAIDPANSSNIFQYYNERGVFLNGLQIVSSDEVWAVGGRLLHSKNHGLTWDEAKLPEGDSALLWAVKFADRNRGWVCGGQGVLFSTRDGGLTWQREQSPANGLLSDIAVTQFRVFIISNPSQLLVAAR
jgi:photosystem II stability/assembly factor-like uncharacterized protein